VLGIGVRALKFVCVSKEIVLRDVAQG
jgi:hypothetical protein